MSQIRIRRIQIRLRPEFGRFYSFRQEADPEEQRQLYFEIRLHTELSSKFRTRGNPKEPVYPEPGPQFDETVHSERIVNAFMS